MDRWAAAAIALVIGCSGPRSSDPRDEVVLRVSAVAGLPDFVPGIEVSGSSAAAMDLVYSVPDPFVESIKADGDRLIIVRRASSGLSIQELATLLRGRELISAAPLDERRIEAKFKDAATATLVEQYGALGIDIGPYQVDSQEPNRIRLVRRGESSIDAIELIKSTRTDEWRELLAHELDVIPEAAGIYRAEFAGIDSIRVVDIRGNDTAALYFNVRVGPLQDPKVRRRIAATIRRDAIARLLCRDSRCALPDLADQTDVPLPSKLAVLVPADDTTLAATAKILRHQLWPVGLELDIQPASVPDIVSRMTGGSAELVLLPLTKADHGLSFFLSPGHPKAFPMTGFASAEYDAALERGDSAAARAILEREVPVTRLFELRYFAAIDSAFCGEVTPSASSWLWLSELYPCEEGREQ